MKIKVLENLNPVEVIRRAGYGQVMDRRATEISWSRRLGSGIYPRFHLYLNSGVINLHLDQKQASYEGYGAHSGEYDGDTVEREGERIIEVMLKMSEVRSQQPPDQEPARRGFFSRLFR
jgi:hypothetical protein